jgi:hypothetical protein
MGNFLHRQFFHYLFEWLPYATGLLAVLFSIYDVRIIMGFKVSPFISSLVYKLRLAIFCFMFIPLLLVALYPIAEYSFITKYEQPPLSLMNPWNPLSILILSVLLSVIANIIVIFQFNKSNIVIKMLCLAYLIGLAVFAKQCYWYVELIYNMACGGSGPNG